MYMRLSLAPKVTLAINRITYMEWAKLHIPVVILAQRLSPLFSWLFLYNMTNIYCFIMVIFVISKNSTYICLVLAAVCHVVL
jgi:hypothetical protein